MSSSSEDNYDVTGTCEENNMEALIDQLRPQFLNLMNEFADADMFLIDGDSLLMELSLDKNLDWTHSGQLLHFIYLFERYLHLFVRKDGVFEIVFFKDFDKVCKSSPCLYLARNVIIQHLVANVNYKVLCEFESPWDPEFHEYIKVFVPSFMLLSDGEIMDEQMDQTIIPKQVSKIFVLHLLKVLSLEINCAFTDGLEFGTSTLNGFHIMSSPKFTKRKLPRLTKIFTFDVFSGVLEDIGRLPDVIYSVLIKLNSNSSMFDVGCIDKDGVIDCRHTLHVVTVCVYLEMFKSNENQAFQRDLVRILLLHAVLLTQLPLKYRAFSSDGFDKLLTNPIIHNQFKEGIERLQFIMAGVIDVFLQVSKSEDESSMSAICDTWDGRLIYQILFFLLASKKDGLELPLSECSQRKFECLVHIVSSLLDDNEELPASPILQFLENNDDHLGNSTQEIIGVGRNEDGLIEIECSLLNEYAGEILQNTSVKKLDINDPDVAALVVSGNDFDETYHWHSGKPLSDEYERTNENNSDIQNKRAWQRSQDKYARYMQRYGQSLQGEVEFKPIIVEKSGKKHNKQHTISKKGLAIKNENIQKREEKKQKQENELWLGGTKKVIKQLEEEGKYDVAVDRLDRFLSGVTDTKIAVDILLSKAKILWKKWKEYCSIKQHKSDAERDESDAEILFLTIQDLVEKYEGDLTKKNKNVLAKYLYGLGFKDIVLTKNLSEKSFEFDGEYSLKTSSSRFQLHSIGDRLKRETRTDRDSRVEHFIPETWQRQLLDAVDKKQSALIVAPTSSGKTFASYYCMEQVLKADNDGVVVYVSPTKALVNQVAATCYVRYKKEMPAGKSVYGVFTRDYRHNALTCQILVTVPQCLEILLLSPARRDWVARIKYVVFDEVHCIGSEIGAEVWEHLLLLIRCPFLALSATIRNPDVLHKWLQSAENDKFDRDTKNNTLRPNSPQSYSVALVTYNERYNDLEKFNYFPARKGDSKPSIEHIHPCSVVSTHQLKKLDTFPAHISLSPRETLMFYDALQKAFAEEESMAQLSPEIYFEKEAFITKQNVRSYESDLKEEFMSHVKNNDGRANTVIDSLSPRHTLYLSKPKNYELLLQIYPFLEELRKNDQLPVIFFSFDRALCEDFAEELISWLEDKEEKLVGNRKKEEKQERRKAKAEKRKRDDAAEEEVFRKIGTAGHDDSQQQKRKTSYEATCFLVDDPPPESCSFAGKGVLDAEDAQVIVQRLEVKGAMMKDDERFREGLRRGVSYHHAGMPAKKRGVVEMLFRKKFVRVVFATGTLALGIHMPCNTVVFARDSVFLNTLQFHQISGRAGRRGYDLIGNVIFFGIPQAKIQRLMTVGLPRIIGNFPLNVSLVLRLLLLVNTVEDREIAMNQVLALLQNPLICMNQPELDLQLKHHFLFSIELLVRQGFVDEKGHPQGLSGLATHLHYHEPSNFILVTFLHEGLLHDFCAAKDARLRDGKFSKDFMKSLVILLSHLFARRKLHKILLRRKRSTSKVCLEDLPEEFKDALANYNKNVHDVFDLYLRTVASHVYDTLGEDVMLPLSSIRLISSEKYHIKSPTIPLETLDEKLQSVALSYKACSAFAALSGNTDNRLYSSQDLMSNIRYQVYTDVKVMPTLDDSVDLNGYVYDFFNHGNVKALITENGLMQGDVYQLLKDFKLVLKSISVSLTELSPENDEVIQAFTQLVEEFDVKFEEAY